MKRLLAIMMLLAVAPLVRAQSTTVTGTSITDTDGFVWTNANYQFTFVPSPQSPSFNSYHWTGGTIPNPINGSLDGSGNFSVSIPSNTAITPSGSQWKITLCPNATAGCFSVTTPVTGGTYSVTSLLNAAAQGPRFAANVNVFGYTTTEVVNTPQPGSIFYNTTTGNCQQYGLTGWAGCSPGTAAAGGTNTEVQYNCANLLCANSNWTTDGAGNTTQAGNENAVNGNFSGTVSANTAIFGTLNGEVWPTSTSSDIGAQITAAITLINPHLPNQTFSINAATGMPQIKIVLPPNQTYTATTQVLNAGIGVLIDCNGSSIDISALASLGSPSTVPIIVKNGAGQTTINAIPFIEWSNPNWGTYTATATPGPDFVNPVTGIQNCKFIGPKPTVASSNIVYAAYSGGISNWGADNLVTYFSGGVIMDGPSANNHVTNMTNYHPLNQYVNVQEFSSLYNTISGAFAPGKVLWDHIYVEEAPSNLAVVGMEMQSGDPFIRDPHLEAVAIGIHVYCTNTSNATIFANCTGLNLQGGIISFRTYNNGSGTGMRGIVIDSAGNLSQASIKGTKFISGESQSVTDYAIQNNWAQSGNYWLNLIGTEWEIQGTASATFDGIQNTTGALHVNATGNHIQAFSTGNVLNFLSLIGGNLDQGVISGNTLEQTAGSTAINFMDASSTGAITNSGVTGNDFVNVTAFTNLGVSTNFSVNNFLATASGPTVTFTAVGKFLGNQFASGLSPTVTLDGSDCLWNTNYLCPIAQDVDLLNSLHFTQNVHYVAGTGWVYDNNGSGMAIYQTGSNIVFSTFANNTLGTGAAATEIQWAIADSGGNFHLQKNLFMGSNLAIPLTGQKGSGNSFVSLVPGGEDFGSITLSSGTATASSAAACTPSATCIYKLINCGKNASSGIGTLSIGTVTPGTSFAINSLGPTASVLTTDGSTVCWQIN